MTILGVIMIIFSITVQTFNINFSCIKKTLLVRLSFESNEIYHDIIVAYL